MPTLQARAFAKVNLYLDVLSRRPDGYHNIETIFQTVRLYDELTFELSDDGIAVDCSPPLDVPESDNFVHKAATALRNRTGTKLGARIALRKHIPSGAGLGGGSSDAAATLVGLNRLWKLELAQHELEGIGAELGADVAFFIEGGTALGLGIGDRLQSLPDLPETWLVLAFPEIHVTTAKAYGGLSVADSATTNTPPDATKKVDAIVNELARGNVSDILHNSFEHTVLEAYAAIADAKQALLDAGARSALMTGSGSCVFGIADDEADAKRIKDEVTSASSLASAVASSISVGIEFL
ncbi:4-(cytidine 5'-diphospho)-2-C-methyl-D-erythritol kinase [Candidatus Hydrogenedentota bacterium]